MDDVVVLHSDYRWAVSQVLAEVSSGQGSRGQQMPWRSVLGGKPLRFAAGAQRRERMGSQVEHGVPYRLSIYWKVENEKAGPSVLVYAFGGLIRLNQTASLIWEMVDGRHSEEEMFAALRRHFPEAAAERLRDDLESFLQSAQASGLILRHWSPLQPYEILYEELVP